jgi:hypothetical protein
VIKDTNFQKSIEKPAEEEAKLHKSQESLRNSKVVIGRLDKEVIRKSSIPKDIFKTSKP